MNDYGTSVLLGIVEGLTEFLPVSSTAHLLVTENALGLNKDNWEAFTVVIQLGAVLSVVAVYWRKFWDVLVGLPSDLKARQFAVNVIIAFLPSAVLGAVFIKYINGFLLDPSRAIPVIGTTWLLGGILIFASLFLMAQWATRTDPQILRILLNSSKFRREYDPAKFSDPNIRVIDHA